MGYILAPRQHQMPLLVPNLLLMREFLKHDDSQLIVMRIKVQQITISYQNKIFDIGTEFINLHIFGNN